MKPHFPLLFLKDGTKVSVQASQYHHCTPRTDRGPYTEVEVGFPTKAPTGKLLDYADDAEKPTQTVYAYVPIDVVEEFIAEHGGLDLGATLSAYTFRTLHEETTNTTFSNPARITNQ